MRLQYKLALGSVLLMGSGVLGIGISSYHLIQQTRHGELESKAELLLRSFVDKYNDALQRKDTAALAKGLHDLTSDPEIVYGVCRDMEGKIIAGAGMDRAAAFELSTLYRLRKAHDPIVAQTVAGNILGVSMVAKAKAKPQTAESFFIPNPEPATAQGVGIIGIGLSKAPTMNFIKNVRHELATFVAGTLALTLLISWGFASMISQPMRALLLAIEEIGKGNLHYALDVHSRDEIGQVARAFNGMTADLRRAHGQLVETKAQLEQRLKELAANNRELQSAQEKVVRSEKLAAIGKLASGVGHELRNPLGGIHNALYYIRDCLKGTTLSTDDPSLLEFITLAEKEIKSSNDIIGDLLEFSRVIKLSSHSADVNAVLGDARHSLEVPATVKIVEDYQEGLPKAEIDPQKMRQVFINLALNAFHAMPKGGELRIESRLEGAAQDPQSRILVRFRDTGIGIPPDIVDKIFEPLFTTKAKGTGLGLSICQGFVQAHGGRISVESEVGKGTVMTVALPLGGAATA
jgi:signal transduction histidine kinase